jgi:hypothetical protein
MSWTQTGSIDGFMGAVAFKPAAAAAALPFITTLSAQRF